MKAMSARITARRSLQLGDGDQLMIQGDNVGNPPLVLPHGGPRMSETSFFHHCNVALEKNFTVVYWDRGAAVVP